MHLYVTESSSDAVSCGPSRQGRLINISPEAEIVAKENRWISEIPAFLAKELNCGPADNPYPDHIYKLSTQAELLRLGFDYGIFKFQLKNEKNIRIGKDINILDPLLTPSQILETYLIANFKEIVNDSKKDLSLFDLKEKEKYDFFGQTVYVYTPSAEKLNNFSKLLGTDLSIDEITASETYESLKTYIREGYEKLKEHKIYSYLCNGENQIDMYVYLLPIISTHEIGYSKVNFNQYSLSFTNGKSIFHELTECIGNMMYSPKVGSLLGIATNNILSGNFITDDFCGTSHKFIDGEDEKNFKVVCEFALSLPPNEIDGFITSILDETKESSYNSFRNIDVIDIWHKNKLRCLSESSNLSKMRAMNE